MADFNTHEFWHAVGEQGGFGYEPVHKPSKTLQEYHWNAGGPTPNPLVFPGYAAAPVPYAPPPAHQTAECGLCFPEWPPQPADDRPGSRGRAHTPKWVREADPLKKPPQGLRPEQVHELSSYAQLCRDAIARDEWVARQHLDLEAQASAEWTRTTLARRADMIKKRQRVIDQEDEMRARVQREQETHLLLIADREMDAFQTALHRAAVGNERRTRASLEYQRHLELEELWQAMQHEFLQLLMAMNDRQVSRAAKRLSDLESDIRDEIAAGEHEQRQQLEAPLRTRLVALRLYGVMQQEEEDRAVLTREAQQWHLYTFERYELYARQAVVLEQLTAWHSDFAPHALGLRVQAEAQLLEAQDQDFRDLLEEEQETVFHMIANTERTLYREVLAVTARLAEARRAKAQVAEAEERQDFERLEDEQRGRLLRQWSTELGVRERWVVAKREKEQRMQRMREEGAAWVDVVAQALASERALQEHWEGEARARVVVAEAGLRAELWAAYFMRAHRLILSMQDRAAVQVQRVWRGVMGRRRCARRKCMLDAERTWRHRTTMQWMANCKGLAEDERTYRKDVAARQEGERGALMDQFRKAGGEVLWLQLMALEMQEMALRELVDEEFFSPDLETHNLLLTKHIDFLMRSCRLEEVVQQKRSTEDMESFARAQTLSEEQKEWDAIAKDHAFYAEYLEQSETYRVLTMESFAQINTEYNSLMDLEHTERQALRGHEDRVHAQFMESGVLTAQRIQRKEQQQLESLEQQARETLSLTCGDETVQLMVRVVEGRKELSLQLLVRAEASERTGITMMQTQAREYLKDAIGAELSRLHSQPPPLKGARGLAGRPASGRLTPISSGQDQLSLSQISLNESNDITKEEASLSNSRLVADPMKMAYVNAKIALAELPEEEFEARTSIELEAFSGLRDIIDELGTAIYTKLHRMGAWDPPSRLDSVLDSGRIDGALKSLRPRLPSLPSGMGSGPPSPLDSGPHWSVAARDRQQRFMGPTGPRRRPAPSGPLPRLAPMDPGPQAPPPGPATNRLVALPPGAKEKDRSTAISSDLMDIMSYSMGALAVWHDKIMEMQQEAQKAHLLTHSPNIRTAVPPSPFASPLQSLDDAMREA